MCLQYMLTPYTTSPAALPYHDLHYKACIPYSNHIYLSLTAFPTYNPYCCTDSVHTSAHVQLYSHQQARE
ncbi:hypothetical protein BDN71DRAFT_1459218 [Pleurotus eryngii]|uniref:Uncharacterized protein n=1 Tax=Pleurotus eryngii TaxID=5323 RepID=A0A9P6D7G3_PLEER|nr:hypothetical protein BDN71DRAFT_1459218 [Pleurotus eryngii]